VLVTCPGRKVGETIGHTLVQERLAACVNVAPNLTAIYRDLHPYTIPEIVALPLVGGSAPYLAWLRNSTT
jgi:periplasmic divalent cation tolerance protein